MNIAGQIAGQDHSNTSYFVRQPASFEGQPGAKQYAGSKQAKPELGDFSVHSLCSRSYYSAGYDCIYSEIVFAIFPGQRSGQGNDPRLADAVGSHTFYERQYCLDRANIDDGLHLS